MDSTKIIPTKDKEVAKFYGLTPVCISNYKNSSRVENNRKYLAMKDFFIKWRLNNDLKKL